MTRRAISPRLAMSTFLNMLSGGRSGSERRHRHGALTVSHRAKRARGNDAQGVRSRGCDWVDSPVISVNFRSDAESTPETRKANSFGLVE